MAIKVWKETLLDGSQIDPKSGRKFTITPKDVKDAARNINRMVRKGRKIPLTWEHLDVEESDPEEWKANYARNTFGWAGPARLSTTDDVTAGIASREGTLLVRHDIHDRKDAEQLKKTGYVSPKIYRGYLDSAGEEYSGLAVAHIAASPTVVQWWQAPFSVELSDSEGICLAYCPPEENAEEGQKCPPYSVAFSEWLDALELSATEDPDPEPEEEPAVPEEKKEPPKKDDGDGAEGGMNADLKNVVKAIRDAFGANISDKVSNWHELVIALESNVGGDVAPEPDDAPADDNGNPDDDSATVPAGGPPMVMSTLDKNPAKKKQALAWAKDERAELTARVNAALAGDGRIGRDPRAARQLLRQVGAVEMSFTDGAPSGKRWEKLVADVAAYETSNPTVRLKADGKPLDLSATTSVDRPKLGAGTLKDPTGQLGADILGGKVSVADAAKK